MSYIYEMHIWTFSGYCKWYMRLLRGSELLLQGADFPFTPQIRSWDCEEEAATWLHQVGSTTPTWCSRIAASSSQFQVDLNKNCCFFSHRVLRSQIFNLTISEILKDEYLPWVMEISLFYSHQFMTFQQWILTCAFFNKISELSGGNLLRIFFLLSTSNTQS